METPTIHLSQGGILKLHSGEIPVLVQILRKHGISLECIDVNQEIINFPQGYVGYINLPNRKLVINPKHEGINIKHILRIYYFLFAADSSDLEDPIYDVDEGESFDIIETYLLELKKVVRKGIPVEYKDKTKDLPYLKGKINLVNTTVNRKLAKRDIFNCNYDELSRDIPLNRVLFTALTKAEQIYEDGNTHFINKHFMGVNSITSIPNISLNRNNIYCKKALALAYMILNDLSISDYGNRTYGESLLINFDRVFEEFVKVILINYSNDNNFTYWDEEKQYALCQTEHGDYARSYLPDMLYLYQNKEYPFTAFCILDMKNKTSRPFSNPDVYQMFFYANMLHSKKVILCYPATKNTVPAILKFDNDGFSIKKLHAIYINIAGDSFRDFKNNIYTFIEHIRGVL